MSEFDYLVGGGGTAGCIVAAPLAEDPAVSVGLVEWGPSHQNPFVAGVIQSASSALNPPVRSVWNDEDVIEGTGFFEIGYRPRPTRAPRRRSATCTRPSAAAPT